MLSKQLDLLGSYLREDKRLKSERLNGIREYIQKKETVTIEELCNEFSISPNTVRRYLTELEKMCAVRKIYGGAMVVHINESSAETHRASMEITAKAAIAKRAADMIEEGDVLFMDTGSTVAAMLDYLNPEKNVTIVSTSVPVIMKAIQLKNVNLICLGGMYYENTNSFYSNETLMESENMNFTKLFLGCTGITNKGEVTNTTYYETALKHVIIQKSDKIILTADHTKIGKNALRKLCDFSDLYAFVTDIKPNDNIIQRCSQNNVKLIYN